MKTAGRFVISLRSFLGRPMDTQGMFFAIGF